MKIQFLSVIKNTSGYGAGMAWLLSLAFATGMPVQAALVTANITTTWYEPECDPCNSVFVGSFTYDTTTHAVTGLTGKLSESMTGTIGYDPTTGPNGTDDMTWLSLNHQLANGDSSHTYTWHDSTLGGTFATVFLNDDYLTFATNYTDKNGNTYTSDGWSPASSMNVGRKYYGYPTVSYANSVQNAYALIFVPDDLTTTSTTSLAWDESTDTGSLGLAHTAYADNTEGGEMGSVGMTGTSAYTYGKTGTMKGFPLSETISARAYSSPPSWNPMLMLSVTLNENNQLAVETTAYIAPLTNAPGTYDVTNQTYDLDFVSFDPTQPYAVLNGTAYSRVLGWYEEIDDDFYTTYAAQLNGTNYLWIEKIAGSPELKTYFVSEADNPTNPYTPIFGTAGSSPKWLWDGFMDHNANSVDLKDLNQSNQLFTATYHLYIGDANGNTNANFGDTTTTWRWKGPAVPVVSAPGILWSNSQITVSWATTVTNLTLVSVDSLAQTNWVAVTNRPVFLNGQTTVILSPSSAQKFFRLQLNL